MSLNILKTATIAVAPTIPGVMGRVVLETTGGGEKKNQNLATDSLGEQPHSLTHGSCFILGCAPHRGATDCDLNMHACRCKPGYCATSTDPAGRYGTCSIHIHTKNSTICDVTYESEASAYDLLMMRSGPYRPVESNCKKIDSEMKAWLEGSQCVNEQPELKAWWKDQSEQ